MPIDEGEAVLAVTGVTAALEPGPLRLTAKHLARAGRLPNEIRRRLRRFLAASGPWPKFGKLPPFDYDGLLELLPLPDAQREARLAENAENLPEQELAESYSSALGRAVGYLQGLFPLRVRETLARVQNVQPGDLSLGRFRRAYAIADDPLRVLDHLATGLLTADEVETCKKLYPSLYREMQDAYVEVTIARLSRHPNWRQSRERERKARVLLQAQGDDGAMRDAVQAIFEMARGAGPEQGPQAPQGQNAGTFTSPATPSQQLEAGGASR